MNREDLIKLTSVRIETIKLECLKDTNLKDMEFQLKEMNIAQNKKYNEILNDESDDRYDRCMKYACNEVMIEPSFFTDKEIENLNGFGKAIMEEIFYKIPTIGMTAAEKKLYRKKAIEFAKKQAEKTESDEVDEEKK